MQTPTLIYRYITVITVSFLIGAGLVSSAHAASKYSPGTLIQALDSGTIYFVGTDNRRYPIPNMAVYRTWYSDFSEVKSVPTERELARIAKVKKSVTVRPGTTLVKFDKQPKIYAVDTGAVLRWITNTGIAEQLYGLNWQSRIVTLPESDRNAYVLGQDIRDADTFSRHLAMTKTDSIEDELRARKIIRVKTQTTVASVNVDQPLLKQLKTDVNHGLTPSFKPGTISYRLTANSNEDRVTFTPTANSNDATITVNETSVPSGSPIVINLDSGLNSVVITVQTKHGATQTYMVLVDRTPVNGNPYLQSLNHNLRNRLSPAFGQSIDTYDLRAEYLEGSIVIRPTLQDKRGRVWVNGVAVRSNASQIIPLSYGENIITVRSQAENGMEKIYTIKVYRSPWARSEDTQLKSLQENLAGILDPVFDPRMTLYELIARSDEATIRITARPQNRNATVYINGEEGQSRIVPLEWGETEIRITVAISAEERLEYKITVDRQDPQ